jgi:hypothetical protein
MCRSSRDEQAECGGCHTFGLVSQGSAGYLGEGEMRTVRAENGAIWDYSLDLAPGMG